MPTRDLVPEFDTDEATIDRMMAEGEPAEIVDARPVADDPVLEPNATYVLSTPPPGYLSISQSITSAPSGRPLRRGCARLRAHYGIDDTRSTREAAAS